MKQFNNYAETQAYSNAEKLPAGCYILKIVNVRYETFDWGDRIVIAYDIDAGEQKGFFKKQFDANTSEDKKWKGTFNVSVPKDDGSEQDARTKRSFKSFVVALEASNAGYTWDWDENKWKGKLIGGQFGEYTDLINNRPITWVRMRYACSVDDIKSGRAKTPEPYTTNRAAGARVQTTKDGFVNIPDGTDEDLPF